MTKSSKKERRPRSSRKSETPKKNSISINPQNSAATTQNNHRKVGSFAVMGGMTDCDDFIKQLNDKES